MYFTASSKIFISSEIISSIRIFVLLCAEASHHTFIDNDRYSQTLHRHIFIRSSVFTLASTNPLCSSQRLTAYPVSLLNSSFFRFPPLIHFGVLERLHDMK